MKLVQEVFPNQVSPEAELAIRELVARFRTLVKNPVRLVLIRPGKYGTLDAITICSTKPGLTWAWLAYEALTAPARNAVRLVPFTLSEAKRDCVLADVLRAHLGWRGRTKR